MHHLIHFFVLAVLFIDRWLQKRLRTVVPDSDEVWTVPDVRMGREPIIIGPRRSYAVATAVGIPLGFVVLCGFVFHDLDRPGARGPRTTEFLWILAASAACSLIAISLIAHLLRGGTMVLRPSGLFLRYRSEQVFCPWALFQVDRQLWEAEDNRAQGYVRPEVIPYIIHGRGHGVVATGKDVRTRPLYFSKKGKLVLRDLYAVRLAELLRLLLHLGQRLGLAQKLGPAPTYGDPLPIEMDG